MNNTKVSDYGIKANQSGRSWAHPAIRQIFGYDIAGNPPESSETWQPPTIWNSADDGNLPENCRPGDYHTTRYHQALDVILYQSDSITLLVGYEDGRCYEVNTTAAAIWQAIVQPRTVSEVSKLLAGYEAPSQATLLPRAGRFLHELRLLGLALASE
jgi:hypothetical protein